MQLASGKIRILYVLPTLNGGGAERTAVNLLNSLDRSRFLPKIWLHSESGEFMSAVQKDDILFAEDSSTIFKVHSRVLGLIDKCTRKVLSGKNQRRVLSVFDLPENNRIRDSIRRALTDSKLDPDSAETIRLIERHFAVRVIRNLLNSIKRFRPHVIVSSIPEHSSLLVFIGKYFLGEGFPRWIVREGNNTRSRCEMYFSSEWEQRFWNSLVSTAYEKCDKIIAISAGVKDGLVTHYGLMKSKIVVIPNPIDVDSIVSRKRETIPIKKKFLLACGRLHKQKGFDILIKAFSKIAHKISEILVILGEGPERKSLHELIHRLKMQDRIKMPGFKKNPWKYMHRARCFVLPSRFEGFGHVVGEAMACECPVIVTDCDYGPKEIVENNINGRVVRRENVDELAAAMEEAIANNALRKKFIQKGMQTVTKYRLDKITRLYEESIDGLL